MLFHDVEPFRGAALAGRAEVGLKKLWANVARDSGAGADAELPVTSTLHDCGGRTVVLVTPPMAEHPTEAHFIAVVVDSKDPSYVRYVVREFGRDVGGGPRMVLGEWARHEAGTSHVNYGDGPQPDANAFLEIVCERFTGQ